MNVLIIKLGATGDVVRTTPLLRRFDGEIAWITAAKNAVLLEGLRPGFELGGFQAPAIDKVFVLSDGIEAFGKVARGEVRGRLVLVP